MSWLSSLGGAADAVAAADPAMAAIDAGIDTTAPTLGSQLASGLPGWLGGSFAPAAGSSLGGALSTLSKAQNQGGGSQKAGGPSPMNMQNAQAPQGAGIGRSSGSGELATLLQALDARRNLLLQSAVSGQARPVANPASPYAGGATRQSTGLLGV
jgi:hypothetical protein